MKIKVSEATPLQLDCMVAKAEGAKGVRLHTYRGINPGPAVWVVDWEREPGARHWVELSSLDYSTDWAKGGPIIEREGIDLKRITDALWDAHMNNVNFYEDGPTPLVAAMRCYVASKMGDEVEIPEELQ